MSYFCRAPRCLFNITMVGVILYFDFDVLSIDIIADFLSVFAKNLLISVDRLLLIINSTYMGFPMLKYVAITDPSLMLSMSDLSISKSHFSPISIFKVLTLYYIKKRTI